MRKSIYTPEFQEVCALLRQTREAAGLTQVELAGRFGRLQSFVSNVERGAVRLDVVQAVEWCRSCGASFVEFAQNVEARIKALQRPKVGKAKPASSASKSRKS